MRILFVCKHNRFRSKVAEAVFRKLDTKDEAKSAGIELDFLRPYVAENVKKIMSEKGIELENEIPRQVNEIDLKWADKIIIVADNVPAKLFRGKTKAKVEKWDISDADEQETKKINKIVDEIEKRVKKLVKNKNRKIYKL